MINHTNILEIYDKSCYIIFQKNTIIAPFAFLFKQRNLLVTITAIDNLGFIKKNRLTLTYIFFTYYTAVQKRKNSIIFVRMSLTDEEKYILSLENFYKSSRYYEREIFDLYGFQFRENGDLRRILTDYGFSGNVLLKDFPLTGNYEIHNITPNGKLEYGSVILNQKLRFTTAKKILADKFFHKKLL